MCHVQQLNLSLIHRSIHVHINHKEACPLAVKSEIKSDSLYWYVNSAFGVHSDIKSHMYRWWFDTWTRVRTY
jgi:hypothetical protein